jgi:hypothetical protein
MTERRLNAKNLTVEWVDRGVAPHCPPDPLFPEGVDLDCTRGAARTCHTALPYPAKRCGYFLVNCTECGLSCLLTTAGRLDDPRSVSVACKVKS